MVFAGFFGIILVAVTIFLSFSEVSSPCTNWTPTAPPHRVTSPDNSTCYAVSSLEQKQITLWHDALIRCHAQNGTLAVITNANEDEFLNNFLITAKLGVNCYWIGVDDIKQEGVYRLPNGTIAPYVKIKKNLLSVWIYKAFDCIAICMDSPNKVKSSWTPFVCQLSLGYICQKDAVKPSLGNSQHTTDNPILVIPPPKETVIRKLCHLNGYKLGSKPDMIRRTPLATICARECMKTLSPCQMFNYHPETGRCLGFESSHIFRADSDEATDDKWTVWKVFHA